MPKKDKKNITQSKPTHKSNLLKNKTIMLEKKHFCQLGTADYKITCLGAIKGKVLFVEIVPDKHDGGDEECWKIRINEWKNLRFNKDYAVWYGPENYGKRPFRPFPEVGKTYWFFLHKVEGKEFKYNQHSWQWTHDWQLID